MPIDYRKLDENLGVEEGQSPLEGLLTPQANASENQPTGEIDYDKLDENLGLKGAKGTGPSFTNFLNSLVRKPGVDYSPEAQAARVAKSRGIVRTAASQGWRKLGFGGELIAQPVRAAFREADVLRAEARQGTPSGMMRAEPKPVVQPAGLGPVSGIAGKPPATEEQAQKAGFEMGPLTLPNILRKVGGAMNEAVSKPLDQAVKDYDQTLADIHNNYEIPPEQKVILATQIATAIMSKRPDLDQKQKEALAGTLTKNFINSITTKQKQALIGAVPKPDFWKTRQTDEFLANPLEAILKQREKDNELATRAVADDPTLSSEEKAKYITKIQHQGQGTDFLRGMSWEFLDPTMVLPLPGPEAVAKILPKEWEAALRTPMGKGYFNKLSDMKAQASVLADVIGRDRFFKIAGTDEGRQYLQGMSEVMRNLEEMRKVEGNPATQAEIAKELKAKVPTATTETQSPIPATGGDEEIFDFMGGGEAPGFGIGEKPAGQVKPLRLTESQARIRDYLAHKSGPVPMDEIAEAMDLPPEQVVQDLSILEVNNAVLKRPGGRFQAIGEPRVEIKAEQAGKPTQAPAERSAASVQAPQDQAQADWLAEKERLRMAHQVQVKKLEGNLAAAKTEAQKAAIQVKLEKEQRLASEVRAEQHRAEARTDELTGLGNNRARTEDLQTALQDKGDVHVVRVDLDNVKPINDTYGHSAGSTVLRNQFRTIQEWASRFKGQAYRWGGDEGDIIIRGVKPEELKSQLPELQRMLLANEHEVAPGVFIKDQGASIGWASTKDLANREPGQLLDAADRALYVSKHGSKVGNFGPRAASEVTDEEVKAAQEFLGKAQRGGSLPPDMAGIERQYKKVNILERENATLADQLGELAAARAQEMEHQYDETFDLGGREASLLSKAREQGRVRPELPSRLNEVGKKRMAGEFEGYNTIYPGLFTHDKNALASDVWIREFNDRNNTHYKDFFEFMKALDAERKNKPNFLRDAREELRDHPLNQRINENLNRISDLQREMGDAMVNHMRTKGIGIEKFPVAGKTAEQIARGVKDLENQQVDEMTQALALKIQDHIRKGEADRAAGKFKTVEEEYQALPEAAQQEVDYFTHMGQDLEDALNKVKMRWSGTTLGLRMKPMIEGEGGYVSFGSGERRGWGTWRQDMARHGFEETGPGKFIAYGATKMLELAKTADGWTWRIRNAPHPTITLKAGIAGNLEDAYAGALRGLQEAKVASGEGGFVRIGRGPGGQGVLPGEASDQAVRDEAKNWWFGEVHYKVPGSHGRGWNKGHVINDWYTSKEAAIKETMAEAEPGTVILSTRTKEPKSWDYGYLKKKLTGERAGPAVGQAGQVKQTPAEQVALAGMEKSKAPEFGGAKPGGMAVGDLKGLPLFEQEMFARQAQQTNLLHQAVEELPGEHNPAAAQKAFAEGEGGFIQAWHGSPHKFEKFESEKIGTGEGAQAFGYGLYFTSKKKIAGYYARYPGISNPRIGEALTEARLMGKSLGQEPLDWLEGQAEVLKRTKEHYKQEYDSTVIKIGESTDISPGRKQDILDRIWRPYIDAQQEYLATIEARDILAQGYDAGDPRLYQVTLHKGKTPGEYDYLKWDEPVTADQVYKIMDGLEREFGPYDQISKSGLNNEQQSIIKALSRTDKGETHGDVVYDLLVSLFRNRADNAGLLPEWSRATRYNPEGKQRASEFLRMAGIDGIEYPAGSLSGMAEKGVKNYVVFDPEAVTIEKRYTPWGEEGAIRIPPPAELKQRFMDDLGKAGHTLDAVRLSLGRALIDQFGLSPRAKVFSDEYTGIRQLGQISAERLQDKIMKMFPVNTPPQWGQAVLMAAEQGARETPFTIDVLLHQKSADAALAEAKKLYGDLAQITNVRESLYKPPETPPEGFGGEAEGARAKFERTRQAVEPGTYYVTYPALPEQLRGHYDFVTKYWSRAKEQLLNLQAIERNFYPMDPRTGMLRDPKTGEAVWSPIPDYVYHLYQDPPSVVRERVMQWVSRKVGVDKPDFLEHRIIPTLADAKEMGLHPVTDPRVLLPIYHAQFTNLKTLHLFTNSLLDAGENVIRDRWAYQHFIKSGKAWIPDGDPMSPREVYELTGDTSPWKHGYRKVDNTPGGWVPVDIPLLADRVMPRDLAEAIKRIFLKTPHSTDAAIRLFDKFNRAIKIIDFVNITYHSANMVRRMGPAMAELGIHDPMPYLRNFGNYIEDARVGGNLTKRYLRNGGSWVSPASTTGFIRDAFAQRFEDEALKQSMRRKFYQPLGEELPGKPGNARGPVEQALKHPFKTMVSMPYQFSHDILWNKLDHGIRLALYDAATKGGMSDQKAAKYVNDFLIKYSTDAKWAPLLDRLFMVWRWPVGVLKNYTQMPMQYRKALAFVAAEWLLIGGWDSYWEKDWHYLSPWKNRGKVVLPFAHAPGGKTLKLDVMKGEKIPMEAIESLNPTSPHFLGIVKNRLQPGIEAAYGQASNQGDWGGPIVKPGMSAGEKLKARGEAAIGATFWPLRDIQRTREMFQGKRTPIEALVPPLLGTHISREYDYEEPQAQPQGLGGIGKWKKDKMLGEALNRKLKGRR